MIKLTYLYFQAYRIDYFIWVGAEYIIKADFVAVFVYAYRLLLSMEKQGQQKLPGKAKM